MSKPKTQGSFIKSALEFLPVLAFMLGYFKADALRPFLPGFLYSGEKPGLMVASALVLAATWISVAAIFLIYRHVSGRLLFTALIVTVFGSATLYWHDGELFKIKLTALYVFFAALLLGGLLLDKLLLPHAFDGAINLTPEGWRKLTIRWGLFFLALAGLNEIIRHTQSDDFWAYFKFPGTAILIFLFTLTQVPLLTRHEDKTESEKPTA